MVATILPVPAALPSPRSPTLSDAEMILPEAPPLRSASPGPYMQRPPSPSSLLYTHSNPSVQTLKLASAPQGRRGASPQVKSPPLSARSSRSNLLSQTMTDGEAAEMKKHGARDDALASSPTIGPSFATHNADRWDANQRGRSSSSSGSMHSEDLENMVWHGFDGQDAVDDSGVVLEEEEDKDEGKDEGYDRFPTDTVGDDDIDNDRWMDGQDDGEDDPYGSAALSRRAEMILANAKKRLNVMEGNLRGARQSLVVTPHSLSTVKLASDLQASISAARERDRRLYGGIGPIPPRTKPYYSSPLSANGSPGHSRGLSETSVPLPFSPSYMQRTNLRASSAMGIASAPWSPAERHGNGRFPIRESKSHEVMREHRGSGWGNADDKDQTRSYSRGSRSPSNTLEPLPEDEDPTLHRSPSVASDLRSQMNDLKGRISSLKQRAQEDNLRRRSLQSLRTPSPFTAAEFWYAGADAYKTSPVAADAGVGLKQSSPTRKALYEEDEKEDSVPKSSATKPAHRSLETPAEPVATDAHQSTQEYPESHYADAEEESYLHQLGLEAQQQDDTADDDFVSAEGDELEPGGNSVYEDAVYELPAAERHEDRVDAFDYEHFFLHSAMGTYSSVSRRSSASSADSIETTRPATAIHTNEDSPSSAKRVSLHQRNPSVDSVSTMASFATAAEDQSNDEETNEQMDQFSQRILPNQHSVARRNIAHSLPDSVRPDSAINMRANGQGSPPSRGSSPASDITGGLQTSKIFSILLESPSSSQPRLALNEEEKRLIYGMAASLQQVCVNLQSTSGDQYERKEWRRRLDEARKLLNGEDVEAEPF